MTLRIIDLQTRDFPEFAEYLNDHISDNGAEGQPLFSPLLDWVATLQAREQLASAEP